MKRVLAIYFPYLATERVHASPNESVRDASAENVPRVVVAENAAKVCVVACNRLAEQAGIGVGMPLAEAKALTKASAALLVYQHDAQADRATLESLAIWCDRYSPVVHIEDRETLLLDMTGSQRLFPDEIALLETIGEQLHELGYSGHLAFADTPGAAWALTHACSTSHVVAPSGQTVAALAPLPVWALRLDEKIVSALDSLGVKTIEALLHLPRSSLASRFGDALLLRVDQALGNAPELSTPFRASPVMSSSLHIAKPTDRFDILHEAINRVTAMFCKKLEHQVKGVRQLFLRFERPAALRAITVEQTLSRPTRSVSHVRSLLTSKLDQLTLRGIHGGIQSVVLWARHLESLDSRQSELFESDAVEGEDLGHLIDRLSNRLNVKAVVRPIPQSDHQPECAFSCTPALHPENNKQQHHDDVICREHRPLCLLPRPIQVYAISLLPDGPPARFEWQGTRYEIEQCMGPERIETGWWRGPHVQRDYFHIVCHSGQHAWLFRHRTSGKWFLHGWFE